MKYNFKNTKTGEIVVKDFPMATVPSSFVENDVEYKRDFISSLKESKIIIPQHMKAGSY